MITSHRPRVGWKGVWLPWGCLKNSLTVVEWVLASHTSKAFVLLPYMPHIFLWKQLVSDDKGAFILFKLKCEKQMYKSWKQGESTRQEYRSFHHACRDGIWKAKIVLEGKLTRDVKDSKKRFFRYNNKMETKKSQDDWRRFLIIWKSG